MGLIYLDSCIVIYLAEKSRWASLLERQMAEIEDVIFGISPLVKCECLVGPAKSSNLALRQAYLDLFEDFATLAMPEEVFLSAAELRATERLNTPDALHLACARHHRCDALWTNDNRFARRARGFVRNILAGR